MPVIVKACEGRTPSTYPRSGVDISGETYEIEAHLTADEWQQLRADIKAGKFDDLVPGDPIPTHGRALGAKDFGPRSRK